MTKTDIGSVLLKSSTEVLETMFFAASTPCEETRQHVEALACAVLFNGAEEGICTVAVDRAALGILCDAFYGDDDEGSTVKEREVLCELANMLTGGALSTFTPDQYCSLSSPLLCNLDRHLRTAHRNDSNDLCSSIHLEIDGGLLSVSCRVKVNA